MPKSNIRASMIADDHDIWLCHYCGIVLYHDPGEVPFEELNVGPNLVATVDHVIPRSKGGTDDLDNLVLSCQRCNSRKHTKSYDEFIKELHRG